MSVAVSIAVMWVAVSVIGGFEQALTEKLTGLAAHITVTPMARGNNEPPALKRNADFEEQVAQMEGCRSVVPFVTKMGMVRSHSATEGVMFKGLASEADTAFLHDNLTAGRMPHIGGENRTKEVLVSSSLASALEVEVGEKIEFLYNSKVNSAPVRRDSYKIVGIYNTGLATIDRGIIYTDLRNLQRIHNYTPDQVSGYEIIANDMSSIGTLTDSVRVRALYSDDQTLWRTTNIHTSYPQIFDWLATHDINGLVIMVIMLAVALLNMITALLIIIFERIQMIGTLKALGMRNGAIQRLFLWRSLGVVLRGVAWGSVVALAIITLQHFTGLMKLDAEAYLLSQVPVAWAWGRWVAIDVLAPVVLVALLAVPVAVVARIKPEQTLKYQ